MAGYKKKIADWNTTKTATKRKENQRVITTRLRRAILEPDVASKKDDEVTLHALCQLGNAAIIVFADEEPYVPRRVLVRAAARLGMNQQQKSILFPDHGYPDGETFLIHLRGGNSFYATPRSRARKCSIEEVTRILAKPQGSRGYKPRRRTPPTEVSVVQGGPVASTPDEQADQGLWADEKGISDNPLVTDAIAGCAYPTVLRGLIHHRLIEGINTDETIVEAVNRYLNSNVSQGTIGFDIANMRLCYQRLRWDASALQRILAGNTSRNRPLHTKARIVQTMAHRILAAPIPTEQWLFKLRRVQPPKRTTAEDLCRLGYTLQTEVLHWTQDAIVLFFQSIARYDRAKTVIGTYPSVYAWIAKSEMKGSRPPKAVRGFAERVFNAKKKRGLTSARALTSGEVDCPATQPVNDVSVDTAQSENDASEQKEDTDNDCEFAEFVRDIELHPCDFR